MSERCTLKRLNEEYWRNVPDNLQEPRWFDWYLAALYEEPRVARSTHQRVADMFDHYGMRYNDKCGVVEYAFAADDPPHVGEKTSYDCEIHGGIDRSVNKMKFGVRVLGQKKGIKPHLSLAGHEKSHFDWVVRWW